MLNCIFYSVHPKLRDGLWKPPLLGSQQSGPATYTLCFHYPSSRYSLFLALTNINKLFKICLDVDTDYFWIKTSLLNDALLNVLEICLNWMFYISSSWKTYWKPFKSFTFWLFISNDRNIVILNVHSIVRFAFYFLLQF